MAMESRHPALFDLTFTSPEGFLLAAVGDRVDSAAAPKHMVRTRWVTRDPIRNASFNIGIFDRYEVPLPDIPPTTVLWSENLHRTIGQIFAQRGRNVVIGGGKNMKAQVGDDVANALRFFRAVYGKAPVQRFYATDIPWLHGEAWPGIIGLSWATFFETSQDGSDEIFRAHEVAPGSTSTPSSAGRPTSWCGVTIRSPSGWGTAWSPAEGATTTAPSCIRRAPG